MANTDVPAKDAPEGSWRDDDMFKEFSCYGQTDGLDDPWSSGFNLIGGGGSLPDEDAEEGDEARDDRGVVFYLQELDSGDELETRLTPDAARRLAERLYEWADDAEAGERSVEEAIEGVRASWYAKGGILAGSNGNR